MTIKQTFMCLNNTSSFKRNLSISPMSQLLTLQKNVPVFLMQKSF